MKRTSLILLAVFTGVLALGVLAAAQPPPPPVVPSGYAPPATPDAANVIVIPPATPVDLIDRILADPAVLTPIPTLDQRTATIPENFLRTGITAIVVEGPLNVRDMPSTGVTSTVITQLNRGEDVTILDLSPDLQWAYIDARGPSFLQGWASTLYLAPFDNTLDQFADSLPPAAETGFTLVAQQTVNIRREPVLFSPRVGILPIDTRATIIGVTNTYSWWKIEIDGLVGWVSGTYVFPEQPGAYSGVPIISDYPDPISP